ncbi:MAG: ABC transporter ATP-binding protein [Desulforhopalus sp.]
MSTLLDVRNVTMHFGGVHALTDVSFEVKNGEFLSLIGPNGAGKTTLLRTIIGTLKPQRAHITLDGRDLSKLATYHRAGLGLALTNQIVKPFRSMNLQDNVALAAGSKRMSRTFTAMISMDRTKEREQAREFLDLVGIGEYFDQPVTGQPLGVLKRLEVARALALKPRILLLDEPLAGLNHIEANRLADTVLDINKKGMTVVMIEHNLAEVLRVSERLVVLDNGRKIAEGDPQQVMQQPEVQAAYVGKEAQSAAT